MHFFEMQYQKFLAPSVLYTMFVFRVKVIQYFLLCNRIFQVEFEFRTDVQIFNVLREVTVQKWPTKTY
jgi:hypothetical protein